MLSMSALKIKNEDMENEKTTDIEVPEIQVEVPEVKLDLSALVPLILLPARNSMIIYSLPY